MRLLFLSQARCVEDQPDFHVSFLKALGADNYRNIPYRGLYASGGWPLIEKSVLEANEDFKPNAIYFQFFHAPENVHPKKLVRDLKATANHPLVLGSLGDLFDTGPLAFLGRPLPSSVTELASEADAFFSTSVGQTAEKLVRHHGARNFVFLPHAYCSEHFPFIDEAVDRIYDVLTLGRVAQLVSRRPVVSIPTALKRRCVVSMLERAFGKKFAVYGYGWEGPSAHGAVPFKEQVPLFKKGKVVVDFPPRISEVLYASDRPYFICGAGSSLVMPYTPKLELLFEPDVHAHFVYRLRDVVDVCRRVLSLPSDIRSENERQTVEYIRSRNLISHRVDTILSVLEAIMCQRSGAFTQDESLNHLRLWHFRPELSRKEIMPYAVVNWRG